MARRQSSGRLVANGKTERIPVSGTASDRQTNLWVSRPGRVARPPAFLQFFISCAAKFTGNEEACCKSLLHVLNTGQKARNLASSMDQVYQWSTK